MGLRIKPLPSEIPLLKAESLFATGFGSGLISPAPGTWGTLAFLPIVLPVIFLSLTLQIIFIAVLLALSFWSISYIEKRTSGHDQGFIVIDEGCGLACAFLFTPASWTGVLLAFLLFRLFDILKPWPICLIDRKTNNSFGVIADDVIAGIAAGVCVYALGEVYAL
tara:strand:- start:338 stop:832 length:495 start_codon:yes stop_codon:yes gene_type:complete